MTTPRPFRSNFLNRTPGRYDGRYKGTSWIPAHYDDYDVVDLHREHGQLRWSVFAMHWSIIAWCATYDEFALHGRVEFIKDCAKFRARGIQTVTPMGITDEFYKKLIAIY